MSLCEAFSSFVENLSCDTEGLSFHSIDRSWIRTYLLHEQGTETRNYDAVFGYVDGATML